MTARAPVGTTARLLLGGTLASALAFAIGFIAPFVGAAEFGAAASMSGIVVLLVTPAAGLLVTAIEMRLAQPQSAIAAVGVLAVLALAVVVALAAH